MHLISRAQSSAEDWRFQRGFGDQEGKGDGTDISGYMTVRGYRGEKVHGSHSHCTVFGKRPAHLTTANSGLLTHARSQNSTGSTTKSIQNSIVQLLASDSLVRHVYLSYTSHSPVRAWAVQIDRGSPPKRASAPTSLPRWLPRKAERQDGALDYLSPSLDQACLQ